MRCRFCGDRVPWWRRRCADCRQLWSAWETGRSAGMRALLEVLHGTGAAPDKIERFLNAEPQPGAGTLRDQMAAEMSNQLLDALGQPGVMSGAKARRLRERGAWRDLDRRPPDANKF